MQRSWGSSCLAYLRARKEVVRVYKGGTLEGDEVREAVGSQAVLGLWAILRSFSSDCGRNGAIAVPNRDVTSSRLHFKKTIYRTQTT